MNERNQKQILSEGDIDEREEDTFNERGVRNQTLIRQKERREERKKGKKDRQQDRKQEREKDNKDRTQEKRKDRMK